ncbi:MAG: phasin family protein [Alphaproteobacteria bacterium]|nr:phasin family protein [Alphaproteobacteria bacterium]MCK5554669.1 phasin family protein [Alphaproteobacteria bacterium]
MQNDIMDNIQKMTQATMDNLKKISETNIRASEKLMQEMTDLTTTVLEAATEGAEDMAETKNYSDIPSMQAKMSKDLSKKVMDTARTSADILADAGKVYAGLFEAGMKEASNKATPKARKSA